MNELAIFENPDFGRIQVLQKDGEPWFIANDVCRVLDIGNPSQALTRLENDEKGIISNDTLGGKQEKLIISEAGLYSLVLGSRKPEAKKFKRWVTHDVLPAIRKHGLYAVDDVLNDPDMLISALTALKEERAKAARLEAAVAVQNQQIAELQPKASYYDVVLNCKDLVAISVIAKDYGWSASRMNKHLAEKGIQYRQGNIWLLYQKYADKGYTSTKTHSYPGNDGEVHTKVHTYWTQQGRLFIYSLLKNDGIMPLIEQENDDE